MLVSEPKKFDRRTFAAGAATSIPSLVGHRSAEGNGVGTPRIANDANPTVILPSDITTDKDPNQKTKDSENFETQDFRSVHFPYEIRKWPTDWLYQPGLAYGKEIDMFFGKFFRGTQTKAWSFTTALLADQTPGEFMNTIQRALQHEQNKQGKAQNLPLAASDYVGTIDGQLEKLSGYDGWSITAPMLGYAPDTTGSYFQANMGIIKGRIAYQFNLLTANDSLTIHYEYEKKFIDAMNSLAILN